MATTRILTSTNIPATAVTAVHAVATAKKDTVRVLVVNTGTIAVTYRLFVAPLGVAHNDDQAVIWDETISSPGSGKSPPLVLIASDVIRAYASTTGLKIIVNGLSQDL